MKKLFLTVYLLTAFAFGVWGQTSFIGKSKDQVRDFWETKVSVQYMDEGKYDDTGEEYFDIMAGNVGQPIFSATFSGGKCTEHSTKIDAPDISVYQARLKKQGFSYDKVKDHWKKSGAGYVWKIDQDAGGYSLVCTKV